MASAAADVSIRQHTSAYVSIRQHAYYSYTCGDVLCRLPQLVLNKLVQALDLQVTVAHCLSYLRHEHAGS